MTRIGPPAGMRLHRAAAHRIHGCRTARLHYVHNADNDAWFSLVLCATAHRIKPNQRGPSDATSVPVHFDAAGRRGFIIPRDSLRVTVTGPDGSPAPPPGPRWTRRSDPKPLKGRTGLDCIRDLSQIAANRGSRRLLAAGSATAGGTARKPVGRAGTPAAGPAPAGARPRSDPPESRRRPGRAGRGPSRAPRRPEPRAASNLREIRD